jgi:photosystem II stability/assembly factor-like uncharacterized protein
MKIILFIIVILSPLFLSAQWNIVRYTPSPNQAYAMTVVSNDSLFYVNGQGGIFSSIDGGQNWTYFQTIFNTSWFLDIDFPSKLVGYTCGGTNFGTHTNVIAKTIDGGASWDSLTSNAYSGYNFEHIEFLNEDLGFVSGDIPFILKTTDGGSSFTQINLPNNSSVTSISFNSISNVILSTFKYNGQNSKIYSMIRSTDLGTSWTEVYTDTMTGVSGLNRRRINEIFFVDDNYGFAVGGNGLFLKTSDGGVSWVKSFIHPFNNLSGVHFITKDIGYINNAGGIYKTIDGGDNWTVQNISPLSIIGKISFANDTIGYALGGSGIYKTTNGGETAGFKNLSNSFNTIIFPNPFSNQTTLETEIALKNGKVTIFNSYGQEVKTIENISGKQITIFRDKLPSGIYFAHLSEGNEVIAVRKLIVSDE